METEKDIQIVREHYNANVAAEWGRIADRPEFLLTCRMLDRYIKSGDKILDIGGGPGRYSFYLAKKGGDVTLFDLSPENIKFAEEKSVELKLPIKTICGDARAADKLADGQFDHVLIMGPMYHLLEESDRITAMNAALNLLKPGGKIFVSFISTFAGMIFGMKDLPGFVSLPEEEIFIEGVLSHKSFGCDGFTKVFFMEQSEILPFMSKFPLEKLHLFGQESILSPCEKNIMTQPRETVSLWLDLCEKLWEREDLLSWAEHLMYVGKKI